MARRLALAAVAALVATGCGSSHSKTGLTGAQAQVLVAQLEQVRAAGVAHDAASAQARLRAFGVEVAQLRRAGALDAATAAALGTGARRAAARAATELAPPPPQQPTTVTTTPAPAPSYGQGQGGDGGGGGGD
jgi:hypothetical protein